MAMSRLLASESEEKEPLNRNPMTEIAIDSREQAAARASYFAATLVCLVALLAPALWNGYPLLQYDTGGYLARWYEGYLVPSRSTVFGVYLHVGEGMHFWPQLVLQSACTLWIIGLVLRVTGLGSRPRVFLLIVSMLALTTSLPFLNSLLLTDIFSGVSVLALYLLSFHWRGLLASGAGIAAGAAMLLVTNFALSGQLAWTPGGYGIVFGRMLQDGIVKHYLDDHCAAAKYKLCPYRDQLPATADDFLWNLGIFDHLGRFAGLEDE